jgi:hypothetical protein
MSPMEIGKEYRIGQSWVKSRAKHRKGRMSLVPIPVGRSVTEVREVFDKALDGIHYAGACRRVGRCMRLMIVESGQWVGGIVLGSTFPNIDARYRELGPKPFVRDYKCRGLTNPWSRENVDYWCRLQNIVNHARTFVFPEFRGQGIGVRAHRLLLWQGKRHWENRYRDVVVAFDTLCDSADSGLFRRNGWPHIGTTAGYESDRDQPLVAAGEISAGLIHNVGLRSGSRCWEVWIRRVNSNGFPLPPGGRVGH